MEKLYIMDMEKLWYHCSPVKFSEFSKTKDIGYHFGTKEQGYDLMRQRNIKDFYLYTVKLRYNKSLRTIDKKTWFGINLVDIISVHKLAKRKDMMDRFIELKGDYVKPMENKYDYSGFMLRWNNELRDIIHRSGYDSIIYRNKYEKKDSGQDSIIIFDKDNIEIVDIKEIHIGTFLKSSEQPDSFLFKESKRIITNFKIFNENVGNRDYLIDKSDEIENMGEYLNCQSFTQRVLDYRDKRELRRLGKNIYLLRNNKIKNIEILNIGDLLEFNNISHYSIYLGNNGFSNFSLTFSISVSIGRIYLSILSSFLDISFSNFSDSICSIFLLTI